MSSTNTKKEATIKQFSTYIRRICKKFTLSSETKKHSIRILKQIIRYIKHVKDDTFNLLIASTILFFTSKFHDTNAIPLGVITNYLCKNKFTDELILETEIILLKHIDYKLY